MMSAAAHVAWAKDRALGYVDAGDLSGGMASITSDLRKHPDTADHTGIELMYTLALAGHLGTAGQVREFIEGIQ